jgi:predicted RNA-binding Zn-ribbon protein involved in translation (DUF1610 family)
MCGNACSAETVVTDRNGSEHSALYAGCDNCGWEGPAELTRA